MQSLFPLFLKLEGRRCLVVGAGEIGEAKIASLLETKGILGVVAPHGTRKVEDWAREGKIQWR
jgi:precorrin-2 dehydrogenase / sirohydrochlorin ferrochelatase